MISKGSKPYSDRSEWWLKQELIRRSGQLDNAPDDIHKEFYQNRINCLKSELNSRGLIPPMAKQGGYPPDHPAAFPRH